jgi:hypothetical protein
MDKNKSKIVKTGKTFIKSVQIWSKLLDTDKNVQKMVKTACELVVISKG